MAFFSLTSWVKAHLSSLYESPSNATEEDFQEFFDLTFSSNADIILNHSSITRDELRQDIRRRSFAATAVSTEWKDVAEVEQNQCKKEGIVAGFFVVTRTLKFRIRAAPAQMNAFVTFSAKIEQGSQDQNGDQRRIVQLLLTCIDKSPPIHLQSIPDA